MRKSTMTLVLASALVATVTAIPVLYAEESQVPFGSMMDGGMMGMMKMMRQRSQMMDHCNAMVSNNHPNDQWRKKTPTPPDKN